jgi:hypothetical protein
VKPTVLTVQLVTLRRHHPKLGRDRVYLKATRDLQPGEEVFVNYGRDYWKLSSKQTARKPAHAEEQEEDSSPKQEENPQQPAKRTRYAGQRHLQQKQQHQDAAGGSHTQPPQLLLPHGLSAQVRSSPRLQQRHQQQQQQQHQDAAASSCLQPQQLLPLQGLHTQVRSSPRLLQRHQQQQAELGAAAAAAAQLAAAFVHQQQQAMAAPVQLPGWNASMPFPLGYYPLSGHAVPRQLGQLGVVASSLQVQAQQLQAHGQQRQQNQQVWQQQQQLAPWPQQGTRGVAAAGGVHAAVPCGPTERKVPSHPSLGSEESEDTEVAVGEQEQQLEAKQQQQQQLKPPQRQEQQLQPVQQQEEGEGEEESSDEKAPAVRRAADLRQQRTGACKPRDANQRNGSSLYRRRPQRGVSGAGGNPYRRMYTNARG